MPAYADVTFDQLTGLQHYIRQLTRIAFDRFGSPLTPRHTRLWSASSVLWPSP